MSGSHHQVLRRVGGTTVVARPVRVTWLTQWSRERACRKTLGHCWHPDGMIDWWCCECSAVTDGIPPQNCRHCRDAA